MPARAAFLCLWLWLLGLGAVPRARAEFACNAPFMLPALHTDATTGRQLVLCISDPRYQRKRLVWYVQGRTDRFKAFGAAIPSAEKGGDAHVYVGEMVPMEMARHNGLDGEDATHDLLSEPTPVSISIDRDAQSIQMQSLRAGGSSLHWTIVPHGFPAGTLQVPRTCGPYLLPLHPPDQIAPVTGAQRALTCLIRVDFGAQHFAYVSWGYYKRQPEHPQLDLDSHMDASVDFQMDASVHPRMNRHAQSNRRHVHTTQQPPCAATRLYFALGFVGPQDGVSVDLCDPEAGRLRRCQLSVVANQERRTYVWSPDAGHQVALPQDDWPRNNDPHDDWPRNDQQHDHWPQSQSGTHQHPADLRTRVNALEARLNALQQHGHAVPSPEGADTPFTGLSFNYEREMLRTHADLADAHRHHCHNHSHAHPHCRPRAPNALEQRIAAVEARLVRQEDTTAALTAPPSTPPHFIRRGIRRMGRSLNASIKKRKGKQHVHWPHSSSLSPSAHTPTPHIPEPTSPYREYYASPSPQPGTEPDGLGPVPDTTGHTQPMLPSRPDGTGPVRTDSIESGSGTLIRSSGHDPAKPSASGRLGSVDSGKFGPIDPGRLSSADSGRLSYVDSGRLSYVDSGRLSSADSGRLGPIDSGRLGPIDSGRLSSAGTGAAGTGAGISGGSGASAALGSEVPANSLSPSGPTIAGSTGPLISPPNQPGPVDPAPYLMLHPYESRTTPRPAMDPLLQGTDALRDLDPVTRQQVLQYL